MNALKAIASINIRHNNPITDMSGTVLTVKEVPREGKTNPWKSALGSRLRDG